MPVVFVCRVVNYFVHLCVSIFDNNANRFLNADEYLSSHEEPDHRFSAQISAELRQRKDREDPGGEQE
jgi:hypothetical protein